MICLRTKPYGAVLLTILGVLFFLTGVYGQNLPDALLLKDYKPKSIYNVPRTLVERAEYPVVDIHSHPYARSPEAIAQWVKTMDEVGIERTMILTYSTGARFDSVYAAYAGKYPGRFDVGCGFDYTGYDKPGYGPAAVAELQRCYDVGARSVGELGDKGSGLFYSKPVKAKGMHIDDPRMDPLLRKCADLGMPVIIHVAEPKWMYETMDATNDGLMNAYEWRLDNKPDILDHAEVVNTLAMAAKRHPRTTFIACHLANCSYDLEIFGAMLDKYPNLYGEIGARYAEMAPIPRAVNKFITKYQDRILYGTDMGYDKEMYQITFRILESEDEHFYELDQFGYHWPLNGFGLGDRILKKIYRDNALKILNK